MKAPDPDLDALERQMAAAVADQDYETAARLRDALAAARGDSPLPPTRLRRQQPGAMGLGSDQQVFAPPPGWVAPAKPDPMTSGRKRRR